jgi:hypothetical protein
MFLLFQPAAAGYPAVDISDFDGVHPFASVNFSAGFLPVAVVVFSFSGINAVKQAFLLLLVPPAPPAFAGFPAMARVHASVGAPVVSGSRICCWSRRGAASNIHVIGEVS